MPLPKKSKSSVGSTLSGDIFKFMEANSNYLNKPPANAQDPSKSIEDGNRAIAEAIAYGISKALSDPKFISSLTPLDNPLSVSTSVNGGVCVANGPITGGYGSGSATSLVGKNLKEILKSSFNES